MHTGRAHSEPTSASVANSLGVIKTAGTKSFFKVLKIHTLVFCVMTTCRLLSLPKLLKGYEQYLALASVYWKLFIKFNSDSFPSNISRTLREAQTEFYVLKADHHAKMLWKASETSGSILNV
jgi:hypothetical protein